MYERHEHNIIRVDYPIDHEKEGVYKKSAEILDAWEADQLLVTESRPAIYVTEDYYLDWDGYRRIRRGFIALLRVEDFSAGNVLPHERTFPKHKEDRRRLLETTHAMFNPVFSFYSDADRKIAPILKNVVDRSLPDWNFRFDDGVTRTLWTLTDQRAIEKVVEAMKSRPVFIADGHHRYETALGYARDMDAEYGTGKKDMPYHYVLMYCVSMEDEGLSILPTHRMFRNLPNCNEAEIVNKLEKGFVLKEADRRGALERIYAAADSHAMGIQIGKKFFELEARPEAIAANKDLQQLHETVRHLNVSICEEMIIKAFNLDTQNLLQHIKYEVEPERVNDGLETGEFNFAVYLAPISIHDLEAVARAKQVMPQKSTFFYPKLLTGLVIYRFSVNNT